MVASLPNSVRDLVLRDIVRQNNQIAYYNQAAITLAQEREKLQERLTATDPEDVVHSPEDKQSISTISAEIDLILYMRSLVIRTIYTEGLPFICRPEESEVVLQLLVSCGVDPSKAVLISPHKVDEFIDEHCGMIHIAR